MVLEVQVKYRHLQLDDFRFSFLPFILNFMNKYIFLLAIIITSTIACRPVKKVQSLNTALDKKDTALSVVIKTTPIVDSVAIVKEIMAKVMHQKIDFNTFNAKIKISYYGQEENQNVTAYLGIKKDSIIFIQIKGDFGIVGLQAKITKDSVTVVSKIPNNKYVQYRSIAYLQEVTQIPFTFSTLQDLLIGNPVFLDSNIVSYRNTNNDQLLVFMIGNVFKNLLTLDKDSHLVLHSKLDDVDIQRNRTCDITLSQYKPVNGFQFSTYRNISVAEKSKLDVNMEFKEYTFNEMLKYSFTAPKNYKRK